MKTNIMNFAKKYLVGCTAIAMALSTVGCETLTTDSTGSKKKKKDSSWFSFKKREYQIPQSMNVTWTHDILTLPGKLATRGFGGRFYFYNEKTQAIPVEGDLVVYGFDDTHKQKSSEDLNQATKRFRFTAEQFTTHFTEGELGASYSIWIPWDEAYGEAKKIMLIPTFMTKEGRTIRGAAASLNLPGKSSENINEGIVQQTSAVVPTPLLSQSFDLRTSGNGNDISGLRTTTIQVPPSILMRQQDSAINTEITGLQTQQIPAAPSHFEANQYEASSNALLNATLTSQPNQSNAVASFGPPKSMPVTQSSSTTKNTNEWALPEYAPMNWTGLSPRSAPSQFQVPTSQGVQPSSYPTR